MQRQERFIPENYTGIMRDDFGKILVYLYEKDNRYVALGYINKQRRSAFHYSFRTEGAREEKILGWLSDFRNIDEAKIRRKLENQGRLKALKMGDILVNSWGWEQTNVDFYQVTKKSKLGFGMMQIHGHLLEGNNGNYMAGEKIPVKGQFVLNAKEIKKNSFSMRHGMLSIWDGKPQYCSWYA